MAVLTDPISDFLTRFKNCCRAGNEEFSAPYSRIKADIAKILQEEGYIWNYEVVTTASRLKGVELSQGLETMLGHFQEL
ncbi:MAG: 30S ribosomal protein S8, partial [Haloferula sp.]